MQAFNNLATLNQQLIHCRRCPRLVAWREQVAHDKRPTFADWEYWGKPVPGFGDQQARLLVVGLAPAAHGGNRTGRMFTGDRSGEWLYRALYDAGFANQAESQHRDDGMQLRDCYITAIVKCAPPLNKPTATERYTCNPWLQQELMLLTQLRIIIALGQMAFQQLLIMAKTQQWQLPTPSPKFKHGVILSCGPKQPIIIGSYHPSQQNTFTKRLTQPMFDAIFQQTQQLLATDVTPPSS